MPAKIAGCRAGLLCYCAMLFRGFRLPIIALSSAVADIRRMPPGWFMLAWRMTCPGCSSSTPRRAPPPSPWLQRHLLPCSTHQCLRMCAVAESMTQWRISPNGLPSQLHEQTWMAQLFLGAAPIHSMLS